MAEQYYIVVFVFLLFIVSCLYSSVGHGGASGYLALMAIFSFQVQFMRTSALILNVIVSFIAFIHFYRGKHFRWKLLLPFAITSVPAAYFGSLITLDADAYKKILGAILLFPVLRLFGFFGGEMDSSQKVNFKLALILGLLIGLLSGMVGIGGGIILSPVIILLGWGTVKEAAAASSLFIFINSISGLAGIIRTDFSFDPAYVYMVIPVVLGG